MSSQTKLRFGKELNSLSIEDIQSLIKNKIDESQNLDYKQPTNRINSDCDNLAKVISSFLNTDGGIILYGVAESNGDHHFPTEIIWTTHPKERLENTLLSRIQPWNELIKIFRIQNRKNAKKGIFVIEVPKSNNPPHMYNHSYYQRMNFQSKPMGHENVYRAFHTSWIRRKELSENVLEPIYAEIKSNFKSIENFVSGVNDSKFNKVISENWFLYDQISQNLRKQIEDFYSKHKEINDKILWTDHISRQIINNEFYVDFPVYGDWITNRKNAYDLFAIEVTFKDLAGIIQTREETVKRALLLRMDPIAFIKSTFSDYSIISTVPIFKSQSGKSGTPIDDKKFSLFWARCEGGVSKNYTFTFVWRESPRLLKLGNKIIDAIKENRI